MSEQNDDAWAGERVKRWLGLSEGLERQLAPVSDVLMDAAALTPGESVLDVGCGTGPTTRTAADAVGTTGSVTGLDISADMLATAASIDVAPGAAPIDWVTADPVEWTPASSAFDVVLSRFGVMFFSDPAAAFATLATAATAGGRLAIAVWDRRDASELFGLPLHATLAVRRAHGLADPDGLNDVGGPFSLSDVAATTALLETAGWSGIRAANHQLALPYGGGLPASEAAAAAADFGPTRLALAGLDDDVRAEAVAAIAAICTEHLDEQGHVVLGGSVIIYTATR